MKKLHYFPFYYLDWLSSSSVVMMTHEEKGLFIDMLARCYNDDGLPDDDSKLQRLFNCDLIVLESVKKMFFSVDGLLKNEKLEKIKKEQLGIQREKSKAGKASAKARAAKKLQKSTDVQQVLNCVQAEAQQNSTNKTKQSKTEQSISLSINPEETTKPNSTAFQKFFNSYPKKFDPNCPKIKSCFFEAVHYSDGEDVILVASNLYAKYFEETNEPIQYAQSAEKWLTSKSWMIDWQKEITKKNGAIKRNLSTSNVSNIQPDEDF